MTAHAAYLVPVRRDVDGTLLVLCGVDALTGSGQPDGAAMWCPDCRATVGGILPGSGGVDLDSPDGEVWLGVEERLRAEHQAARMSGPAPIADAQVAVPLAGARQADA